VRLVDRFLLRAHPPARLKASEAAELLGFHEDDMTVLVRQDLVGSLGEPAHNAVKYFALADVEALGRYPRIQPVRIPRAAPSRQRLPTL